jgi:hypothetical protein
VALPLDGGTYLTTGQAADAVAHGIPALVSPWPYLREALGDGAIPYGRTAADLAATLDSLERRAGARPGGSGATTRGPGPGGAGRADVAAARRGGCRGQAPPTPLSDAERH